MEAPNRSRNRDVGEGRHKHPLHLEPADLFIEGHQLAGKMLRPEDGTVAAGVILVQIALFGVGDVHLGDGPHHVVVPDTYNQVLNPAIDRKSTRLNSSHVASSYAVFCLKKKNLRRHTPT